MKEKNLKNTPNLPAVIEHFVTRVKICLLIFSNFLQQKSNKLSSRTKKAFLLIFCCTIIFESIMVALKSFQKRSSFIFPAMTVNNIRQEENLKSDTIISKSEFENIEKFKFYLDSIPERRKDSILLIRPHLIDTLNYLENIYLKQTKN